MHSVGLCSYFRRNSYRSDTVSDAGRSVQTDTLGGLTRGTAPPRHIPILCAPSPQTPLLLRSQTTVYLCRLASKTVESFPPYYGFYWRISSCLPSLSPRAKKTVIFCFVIFIQTGKDDLSNNHTHIYPHIFYVCTIHLLGL